MKRRKSTVSTMRAMWQQIRGELGKTVTLAWPVVAAELGWMGMGIVDTIFVGRLGPEAIGAVSLGTVLYFAVAVFGMGVLLGLDTLVSQAFGAEKLDDCHQWLVQGVYLCMVITPLIMGVLFAGIPLLTRLDIDRRVLDQAVPFLRVQIWSTLPLFLYAVFRRYLQAMGLVKPVMFALISANVINAFGNWILIYGNLGAPAMGVLGSGWSTGLSRVYMALVLIVYAVIQDREQATRLIRVRLTADVSKILKLVELGWPAAVHVMLEVGVFAAATTLVGMLDAVSLAAHHVVLDLSSVTFMVPLGLSSAAAVRVGQALGRGEPQAAGVAGWTAMGLGAVFMMVAGFIFALVPMTLVSIFTRDAAVIKMAISLMFIAAAFQIFDGLQGVSAGALRGAGDTRTPMVCHLIAHWLVGLPVGYVLAFSLGFGVVGMWIGLAFGLGLAGMFLLISWWRRARVLARGEFTLAGMSRAVEPELDVEISRC
jgi:MATE family multidrug resistance protein